ncbi:MAG TPA: hypothetical protein VN174_00905 [Candidatus Methanoperedens sp.]|nr:hypothetical protein [Candidatus Methanoperedens sp.]
MLRLEGESKICVDPKLGDELGRDSLNDVNMLCEAMKIYSSKLGIDLHLLLVGGVVKPEKKGFFHKDVDLRFYSRELACEFYLRGECPKFDKFAEFISTIGKDLEWGVKIEKPWFDDYESSGDGKVVLLPQGKPIEVLPVREDRLFSSFEEFLSKETEPYFVLF